MAKLTPREVRHYRALEALMKNLGVKDQTLATILGISRSAVQSRRKGGVKLRPDQCDEMAAALGVPALLFEMDVPDVLKWLADNRREQVIAASRCTERLEAVA